MKKFMTLGIMGAALLVSSTSLVNATEVKKTHEVERLVGYNVTKSAVPGEVGFFVKADTNQDGLMDLREFQNRAMLENEYDVFISMDDNRDGYVSVEEFGSYNRTKPQTVVQEGSRRNWNLRTETTFVPVDQVEYVD